MEGYDTFDLPMQDCEITLLINPASYHFMYGDPARFRCRAVVQDGHQIPINNASVLFLTSIGRFFATQSGIQLMDEKLTGQPPDPPGQATLWMIATLAETFTDPLTAEVPATINCLVYGYPECFTDGQQVILRRQP